MNYQTWYLTLTCLVLVSGVVECREYLSSGQETSKGQNNQEGEDDVCCNPDLMQSINAIIELTEENDFSMLVENFNELKSSLEYTVLDEVEEDIFNNLRNVACDIIKDSNYGMCSCDSPVVRKLVEYRMEKITRMYTIYTTEFSELKEILNELNFLGEQPIEEGLIEKQLKDLVCKQCKGLRDLKFMLECQQLMNLGNTFEEKKLEIMESIVKFIQVKVRTLSKQRQEITSATDNAVESLKETIHQLIQNAIDLQLTSCDEVFKAPNADSDLGAGCSGLPPKCVPSSSCTLNNCKDACKVNCCTGAANSKCTIPTCKGCKNAAATATCNTNTARQCAGVSTDNGLNGTLNHIYNLEVQIEEPEIEIEDPDLGAGCSGLPVKCVQSNKASCTLNNCKDACKVNCCTGAANSKCTIPTCKGCKNAAATATCNANTASQCAGISTHKDLNWILSEIYKLQDQIEESELMTEIRGKNTCQRLMDTLEDANILEDTQKEMGSDTNEIHNNVIIIIPDEMLEINELEF